MNNNLFKQSKMVSKWWGAFRNLGTYVMFYLTVINFVLLLMSWYVLISPSLNQRGIVLPFSVFIILALIGFIVVMVLEHKFTLPSYFQYWNTQWWSHGNPLPEQLKEMREQLDRIEKELNKNKMDIR